MIDKLHCDNIVVTKNPRPSEMPKFKRLNEHTDVTFENRFFKIPLACLPDPKDKRDFLLEGSLQNLKETILHLPSSVDHTPKMSPIKDQGYLGSCVGFAVSAMKEWQESYEHEKEVSEGKRDTRKGKPYDLSESWIYWNAKKIDLWPNEEGTSIRYAMKVLNKIGVPTEEAWPYDDVDFGKPERWATLIARWGIIGSYWRISTLEELKVALVDSPVPIGIPCFYEFFFVGNDGIVPYPADPNTVYGGHAVCAVGFNDNKKLVKFKNSWGKDWGQNGYGYLPYKYIKNFLWDAWVSKDMSVGKEMLKGSREL